MVEIKKLPPGEAIGARDLQNWSQRRFAGRSSTFDGDQKSRTMICEKCGTTRELTLTQAQIDRIAFKCGRCGSRKVKLVKAEKK